MTAIDPWRTLGLAPGATEAEIKRAYRRLAKEHHPDRGGPKELPRFLAIQAAYELLSSGRALGPGGRTGAWGGGTGPGAGGPAGGRPWQADPARARATREQWRRRAGGAAGSAGTSRPGGTAGGAGTAPGANGSSGAGTEAGAGTNAGAGTDEARAGTGRGRAGGAGTGTHGSGHGATGSARGSREGRHHHRRKATPGSTTYDDALHEPTEPDWLGSAWYGQASGTYWTINPREYADPRKHGPEYQERARRAARAKAGVADPREAAGAAEPSGDPNLAAPGREASPGAPSGPGPATTGARTHQAHAARPRQAGASPEFGRRSWARPVAGPAVAGDWAAAGRPARDPTSRPAPAPRPADVPAPGDFRPPSPSAPPEPAASAPQGSAPQGSAPQGSAPQGSAPQGGLSGRLGRLFGRGARGGVSGR